LSLTGEGGPGRRPSPDAIGGAAAAGAGDGASLGLLVAWLRHEVVGRLDGIEAAVSSQAGRLDAIEASLGRVLLAVERRAASDAEGE